MKYNPKNPPSLDRSKSIMSAERAGFINKEPTPSSMAPLGPDMGFLGPYPSVTNGDFIDVQGPSADGIWTQQYSAGGSIYDALIDPPQQPSVPAAPNPIDMAQLEAARAMRESEDDGEDGFFAQNPALAGFTLGVILMFFFNSYMK